MAAPTDVRVEAVSPNDTTLYWTYGGSNGVDVYRSTDGVSYSVIANTAASALTYADTLLTGATKYWYKLSDDVGATFSSVVTVWTHLCYLVPGDGTDLNLPRSPVSPDQYDSAMDQLEGVLNNQLLSPTPCDICVSDGRVTLDCSSGCSEFWVDVTEDVNSITIIHCADGQGTQGPGATVHWRVPPSVTRKISGWPKGMGFGGDEGFRLPIAGGSSGRTVSTGIGGSSKQGDTKGKKGPGGNPGSATGGGGGGCACTPGRDNALTIKSCNAKNSLNCSSNKRLSLLVCGGSGGYVWSNTGSIALSKTTGVNTIVTPPTNAAPNESPASAAYTLGIESVGCGHPHTVGNEWAQYNCNDTFLSCSTVIGGTTQAFAFIDASCSCGTHSGHAVSGGIAASVSCGTICSVACDCAKDNGNMQDRRTAGMIAAGCSPCGLNAGATVTVTDSQGTAVTIVVRA